ncbi:hypothetical protein V2G26_005479 [Clonostachys chloroleuca]
MELQKFYLGYSVPEGLAMLRARSRGPVERRMIYTQQLPNLSRPGFFFYIVSPGTASKTNVDQVIMGIGLYPCLTAYQENRVFFSSYFWACASCCYVLSTGSCLACDGYLEKCFGVIDRPCLDLDLYE